MRKTSIEAYREIRDKHLLSRLQFEVYEVVYLHGPISQGEAWQRFFPTRLRHTIAPRFAELQSLGVISPVGERPCAVTGKTVLAWDVTNGIPVRAARKPRQMCLLCQGKGYLDN